MRTALGPSAARSILFGARRCTAGWRALPDFLIIGAQKAGSTSLYAYLSAHSRILPAARKEVHYFDLNYARGEAWYRAMFPLRSRLGAAPPAGRRTITGEASPYYFFHPLAPERAAALVPDARLIVLLRDPVERAWSHYCHEVAAGREGLSFAAALDAEAARLRGAEQAIRSDPDGPAAALHRTASYAARGRYADQLRRWLRVFPRESLLVIEAERLFTSPASEFARAVQFLDLPSETPRSGFSIHNSGTSQPIDRVVRERLADTYREPNEDLADLLGRRFVWSAPRA